LCEYASGVVCGSGYEPENQVLHRDRFAGPETEFRRRPARRGVRDRQKLIEPKLAGIQCLESQIKRHHLGQRRRIGNRVGILLAQHLAGFGLDHNGFADQGWGQPDGRMMRVRMIMQPPCGLCLARDEHQESSNDTGAAAGKNSRRTSGIVAGRTAPLAGKESHFTIPQFPHRLRGFPVICAVVTLYIRKKLRPCPQLEQRLSGMSAAIASWVSIQACTAAVFDSLATYLPPIEMIGGTVSWSALLPSS